MQAAIGNSKLGRCGGMTPQGKVDISGLLRSFVMQFRVKQQVLDHPTICCKTNHSYSFLAIYNLMLSAQELEKAWLHNKYMLHTVLRFLGFPTRLHESARYERFIIIITHQYRCRGEYGLTSRNTISLISRSMGFPYRQR